MSVPLPRSDSLYLVLDTPKGRGVYASCPISAGTVIDTAPVIVLTREDWEQHVQFTALAHYSYNWPIRDGNTSQIVMHQAIVLGLGSMFNHSRIRQNVGWRRDIGAGTVTYLTIRDVKEGEELLISYGDKLWFKDVDCVDEAEQTPTAEDILGGVDLLD
ncbi:hypothetical protein BDZ91DRAFT_674929 [Kalaharituber pfeilii]|nr:hypothetical protein BDZ91DRAFT_674929 [Kalaharituber pfeilii]